MPPVKAWATADRPERGTGAVIDDQDGGEETVSAMWS